MELKTEIFEENFAEHFRNRDKLVLNIHIKNLEIIAEYFPLYPANQITKKFHFSPFQTSAPFVYFMKISEKLWFLEIG